MNTGSFHIISVILAVIYLYAVLFAFSGTSNTFNVNGGRAFPRSGCRTGNNFKFFGL